jgi:hypothetical protein
MAWSGKGYPSPSEVRPAQNDRQKQLEVNKKKEKVKQYNKDIKKLEDKIRILQSDRVFVGIKYWEFIIVEATKVTKTTTNPTVLNEALAVIEDAKLEIVRAKAKIYTYNEEIRILRIQRDALFGTKPKPPVEPKNEEESTTVVVGPEVPLSLDYKYNAPMVSGAYLGKGIAANAFGEESGFPVTAPVFTDAYNAWRGVSGGRGTIQMDRQYAKNIATQQKNEIQIDNQMYGFKFLYNPTTVSMGWGVQTMMDPPYMASGEDTFAPISANLITSTVVFEVLLNRIADFNHLLPNGEFSGAYPYGEFDVPVEDRVQIYERGTMYDLEYFFKTINGPRATFTSRFNGLTSDAGWLLPASLELHLGASMRYRIRINEVSINHIIFNDRMVPLLSTVKFVCGRYNDGPSTPIEPARPGGGGARNAAVML